MVHRGEESVSNESKYLSEPFTHRTITRLHNKKRFDEFLKQPHQKINDKHHPTRILTSIF